MQFRYQLIPLQDPRRDQTNNHMKSIAISLKGGNFSKDFGVTNFRPYGQKLPLFSMTPQEPPVRVPHSRRQPLKQQIYSLNQFLVNPKPGFRIQRPCCCLKLDGFVKSPICPIIVIPAKAGIQLFQGIMDSRSPIGVEDRFRGSDSIFDSLRDHQTWSNYNLL